MRRAASHKECGEPPFCCTLVPPVDTTIRSEVDLKRLIRDVPDFPQPGILFRDITPLLQNAAALRWVVDRLTEEYREAGCTHVMLELWGADRHEQIRLFGERVLPHFRP